LQFPNRTLLPLATVFILSAAQNPALSKG